MHKFTRILSCYTLLLLAMTRWAQASEVDLDIVTKIRDEGFNRSQVMETLSHLSDTIGPRLTGSPQMLEANEWTKEKLTEWGLKNAHLEAFEFGRGWSANSIQVFMTSPRKVQLTALPLTWLPGTDGLLEAGILHAPMKTVKDFEKYKGKLRGKIVLVSKIPEQKEPNKKPFVRHDGESLKKKGQYDVPLKDKGKKFEKSFLKTMAFLNELNDFLTEEGAVAQVRRARRSGMIINSDDYLYRSDHPATLPGVALSAEDYDKAVRLLNKTSEVTLSLNVDVDFHEEDNKAYSTLADISGKGRDPEIVMAGAHMDSWAGGDGTVDNATGVAVVMEAVRILKAIGIKPKRTIRVGLWGGEEQGLYGSQQYVHDHLATRPDGQDERLKYMAPMAAQTFGGYPIKSQKDHERFSVYFNLDHGSGKIRGIYAEENVAAAKVFEDWFQPFHDLGATEVTLNKTYSTDHVVFDQVGLPGFTFIHEPLDYFNRLHHTQLDVFNHAYEKDLKQASVILASFLYNAAMREDRMPRKSLPTGPNDFSKDYDKTNKEDDK
ncbi:M20/M25/M40 family metallo-hydrolase [Paremcibacter congregatus]|uniref:Carboxypeptidase Q n=1 Tax=Paremcibacter congregatus TaxID=2043170 RepID=A0A2G4YR03_9PROT|nr:M20/M25/M40 family metallo-hydrolase [Paremcibacter congregatus]PHZ84749.1 peptidase [Paremcibacter congregatus]QDE28941.1 M20/M25/M40 family metallo-hydrolase [Paremcibacter congregatus]